jgi:hypothetical protein
VIKIRPISVVVLTMEREITNQPLEELELKLQQWFFVTEINLLHKKIDCGFVQ